MPPRPRPTTLGAAVAAAVVVALIFPGSAWAPPAPDVPNMVVSPACVVYGHRIAVGGFGFAAGAPVVVSAPEGHYTGPGGGSRSIRSVTVPATVTGGLRASLMAPPAPPREPWSYQPRVVFADGPAARGGEGESFDEVLIGTARVCATLRGKGPPHRPSARP